MRYFTAFLFFWITTAVWAQQPSKVSGIILNDNGMRPLANVNIINVNQVRGTTTDDGGRFEMEIAVNDTLHLSLIGFKSLRIRVTNDWIKNKTATILMTEKAVALEEVVVKRYNLTGYLEIDSKLIPTRENFRYSISGLPHAYEAGEYSPGAFGRVLGSIFNPADALYNFFGSKPKELKKLREMKKDDTVKNLLETKFDREMISVLLGIDKNEIPEILTRCNYSESFIKTANDLQILDAISQCYEEYRVLKKR